MNFIHIITLLSLCSYVHAGFLSKEEDKTFIKFRNTAPYSTFFSAAITDSNQFKAVYAQYKQFVANWTILNVSTFNQHVPDLKADAKQPLLFARMYDFVDYLFRSGVYIDPQAKTILTTEFMSRVENGKSVAQCRPKAPILADKEIENKTIKYKEYMFLSPECSAKLMGVLKSQEKNIDQFLGFAAKSEVAVTQSVEATTEDLKQRNALGRLREQCKKSVTPDCAVLLTTVYSAAKNRTIVSMLYGKGITTPQPKLDETLENNMKQCMNPKTFNATVCTPLIQETVNSWDEVDQAQDLELYPNPLSYLSEYDNILGKIFTEEDFTTQVMFENYESYKDIDSVFSQVYSMACAFDPSYRLRVSPLARANFLEQELATGSDGITKKIKNVMFSIQGKLKKMLDSDKKIIASLGQTATDATKLASFDNDFLPPLHIANYVKDWDTLTTSLSQDNTDAKPAVTELLVSDKPFIPSSEEKQNIVVNWDAVYAVLSKICMSILGPEYLKAEAELKKAMNTQNKEVIDQTIKSLSEDLKQESKDPSKKDSRAFRYLPSNEYNKLRQVALVILTNIHVLMLDEWDQKRGRKGSFTIVAKQIRDAFSAQINFFSRFLFALKEKKYDASDLSTSPFSDVFANLFIMPIYPLDRGSMPNQATLIDAAGTNIYSLYATYLLGSIYGAVTLSTDMDVLMDNRSAKNRMLGNFTQQFGVEASVNAEYIVSGVVKAAFDFLPIPKPPVLTSVAVSAVSTILLAGPQWIYKGLKSTCRFNKDMCISTQLNEVNLSRPLDVRITEFLESIQQSLITLLKRQHPNIKTEDLDRLMPTLFVLKNDDIARMNLVEGQATISTMKDLIAKLVQDTQTYYADLSVPALQNSNLSSMRQTSQPEAKKTDIKSIVQKLRKTQKADPENG